MKLVIYNYEAWLSICSLKHSYWATNNWMQILTVFYLPSFHWGVPHHIWYRNPALCIISAVIFKQPCKLTELYHTRTTLAYWRQRGILEAAWHTGGSVAYWRQRGILEAAWHTGGSVAYWRQRCFHSRDHQVETPIFGLTILPISFQCRSKNIGPVRGAEKLWVVKGCPVLLDMPECWYKRVLIFAVLHASHWNL